MAAHSDGRSSGQLIASFASWLVGVGLCLAPPAHGQEVRGGKLDLEIWRGDSPVLGVPLPLGSVKPTLPPVQMPGPVVSPIIAHADQTPKSTQPAPEGEEEEFSREELQRLFRSTRQLTVECRRSALSYPTAAALGAARAGSAPLPRPSGVAQPPQPPPAVPNPISVPPVLTPVSVVMEDLAPVIPLPMPRRWAQLTPPPAATTNPAPAPPPAATAEAISWVQLSILAGAVLTGPVLMVLLASLLLRKAGFQFRVELVNSGSASGYPPVVIMNQGVLPLTGTPAPNTTSPETNGTGEVLPAGLSQNQEMEPPHTGERFDLGPTYAEERLAKAEALRQQELAVLQQVFEANCRLYEEIAALAADCQTDWADCDVGPDSAVPADAE